MAQKKRDNNKSDSRDSKKGKFDIEKQKELLYTSAKHSSRDKVS